MQKNLYLVALSPNSEIGVIYAKGDADLEEMHIKAPVLRCSKVVFEDHGWVRLDRLHKDGKGTFPTMSIHGHHIVGIYEWTIEQPLPIGFVPVT